MHDPTHDELLGTRLQRRDAAAGQSDVVLALIVGPKWVRARQQIVKLSSARH